jgi:hypothetical protein
VGTHGYAYTPNGPKKDTGGVRVEPGQTAAVVAVDGHDGFRLIGEGCVPTKTRSRQGEASIGRGSHTKIQSSSPVAAGPAAAGASNPNKAP